MAPANLAYSYDLDGHRTGVSGSLASTQLPAAVSSAVYNADNQLTQWGSTAMTYDADGNTLYDGTNTYTWDARNHLVSANNNGATFVYDGFGRRYGKTMLGANTNFLYDGLNPVQELNGTTPTANLLTGGLDERFTRTDATGTFSYLTDALGSTIALTDTTGNSDVQYSYGPYGNMSITGTSTNSYAYTGREFDGLGIDYYRARYYNPVIARFISEDPIGLAAGTNEYAYVGDNPLNYIDPLGLDRGPGGPGGPNKPPAPRHCAGQAFKKNWVALGLDAASLTVDIMAPESQYVKLGIGLTLSTAATINSAVGGDLTGMGLGIGSYLRAPTEMAADFAGWGWAEWVPYAGAAMDVASTVNDLSHAISDYSCTGN